MIAKYVPDLHCDDMKSNHHLQNRFLKSHNKFTDIDVNYDQCILLFRKPEDCILSYYYYKEARCELSSFYLGNKNEFAKNFVHKWVDFHNSYIDNSLSFLTISCALAVIRSGAIPVYIDADPKTWNMAVEEI